jgi:cell division protein FtsI (penicillin-binding protein 3)
MTRRRPATRRFERRLAVVVGGGLLLGGLVLARLIQVQIVQAGPLSEEADRQQHRTLEVPPTRGAILDRYGEPLAMTVPSGRRERRKPIRQCPRGALASQIIGFCSPDGRGREGIELAFDSSLRGRPGSRTVGANARGMLASIPGGRDRPAVDGADILLTIDPTTQSITERELEKCVRESDATSASAAFLDPRTGDVLAMSSWPTYDPSHPGDSAPDHRRNRALADMNEPGSTFKIVTVAACLEKGLVTPATRVESFEELELAGGHRLRDKKDYGWVTVEEVLTLSVNTATAILARELGPTALYEYARAFGFGCVTGIDLPGEASGILRRPAHWSGRTLETIAIGQEVACTPLQLATAYGAIANGGVLMRPRLVRAIRNSQGRIISSYRPQTIRRVLSTEVATSLTRILTSVVENGTGTEARIPGMEVAGKTGTAQWIDPETKRYDRNRHIASFVGFLPANDPRIVGVVIVDRPRGIGYGGQVAAPCFRRIVEGALLTQRRPAIRPASPVGLGT